MALNPDDDVEAFFPHSNFHSQFYLFSVAHSLHLHCITTAPQTHACPIETNSGILATPVQEEVCMTVNTPRDMRFSTSSRVSGDLSRAFQQLIHMRGYPGNVRRSSKGGPLKRASMVQ